MNLHTRRTKKHVLLFAGRRDGAGRWTFDLSEGVDWRDVSAETKRRLRRLPQEAAERWRRKHPGRDPRGWAARAQRYRPPGGGGPFDVPLGDLVRSLHAIYLRHEALQTGAAAAAPAAGAGVEAQGGAAAEEPFEAAAPAAAPLDLPAEDHQQPQPQPQAQLPLQPQRPPKRRRVAEQPRPESADPRPAAAPASAPAPAPAAAPVPVAAPSAAAASWPIVLLQPLQQSFVLPSCADTRLGTQPARVGLCSRN
jgi:hypothetical protein